jgi:pyruvate dehydrogenase E2 component (dihydrolipoamide acetyltransferase)
MTEIIMPKMGLNMSEGTIVEWLAKTGDEITRGQEIASIESEKVVNNLEADSGGVLHIAVQAGETVPVGEVIGYLLGSGEMAPGAGKSTAVAAGAAKAAGKPQPKAAPAGSRDKPGSAGDGGAAAGVRVSPAARRKAQQLGVDLSRVSGTGPGGRLTIEDVERAAGARTSGPGTSGAGAGGDAAAAGKRIPFTGVRKAIADAMSTSQRDAAEVTLTTEVDCSRLVEARKSGAGKAKISYNAMLIRLVAAGLKTFPYMNARLVEEAIVRLEGVNVGLAMEADQGLVVPVVRDADSLTVEQIEAKIQELINKVQNRTATPDDFKGGTFTVTNLGAYGIDAFTPIINPGQTAILGVGRIAERPVVRKGGVEVRPTCVLSLTFDHRLVDGAPAAQFLAALKNSIENLA